MSSLKRPDRCRIVLVAPAIDDVSEQAAVVEAALSGGDVASLILIGDDPDEKRMQSRVERLGKIAHARDVALIVAGEPRLALRGGADGVHLECSATELAEAVANLQGQIMVGAGGARTRHEALELGEARPDYVFFGRFGYDNTPAPHPRNLSLGRWWAEIIEISCIVQGGSDWRTAAAVAESGAEFVALSAAIFGDGADPASRVAEINALLDQTVVESGLEE